MTGRHSDSGGCRFVFGKLVRLEGIEPPALRSGGAGRGGAQINGQVRGSPYQVGGGCQLALQLLQRLLQLVGPKGAIGLVPGGSACS